LNTNPSPTCPNCGAPLNSQDKCDYCGDPRPAADKNQACLDFLGSINQKLENITPGIGWLTIILCFGFPVLVLASGFFWAKNITGWIIAIGISTVTYFIFMLVMAATHQKYQDRLFYLQLYPLIDHYLQKQEIKLEAAIQLVQKLPRKTKPPALGKYLTKDVTIEAPLFQSKKK
jgi:hypothetical protein